MSSFMIGHYIYGNKGREWNILTCNCPLVLPAKTFSDLAGYHYPLSLCKHLCPLEHQELQNKTNDK